MRIGIPTEIKPREGRVALIPAAAAELVKQGHEVYIQSGAGLLSGYTDSSYELAGLQVVADAKSLYAAAQLIVKVKEPVEPELSLLTSDHILFSYLHLAVLPELTERLCQIGLKAIAFETVQLADGSLPLLAPMSDIAGRIALQVGTHLLHAPMGGRGILLGGVPAAERGKVVVLGAGVAGGSAVHLAARLGAEVIVFDTNRDKMQAMRAFGPNVTALYPHHDSIFEQLQTADLLVGAVLVAGEKSPHLVNENDVQHMRQGSVIIDISVDQGGCIETTRPTTYAEPTFVRHGVVHFGVTNMPGAVPRTASQSLSASLIPHLVELAKAPNVLSLALQKGINIDAGEIVHPALK